jgi:hypothetical protein
MAKWLHQNVYTLGMGQLSLASIVTYCSGIPLTYASAVNSAGCMLGSGLQSCLVSGLAASTYTASFLQGGSCTISFAGTCDHIAHCDGSAGTLLCVTTATSQAVTVGNTAYVQAHTLTMAQPT